MEKLSSSLVSVLSSAILGTLTLSVFFISRNRGPISAVTRFSQSAARRDFGVLQSVSYQPTQSNSVKVLWYDLTTVLNPNTPMQFALEGKNQDIAIVSAIYSLPGRKVVVRFAVRNGGNRWFVDSNATLAQAVTGQAN